MISTQWSHVFLKSIQRIDLLVNRSCICLHLMSTCPRNLKKSSTCKCSIQSSFLRTSLCSKASSHSLNTMTTSLREDLEIQGAMGPRPSETFPVTILTSGRACSRIQRRLRKTVITIRWIPTSPSRRGRSDRSLEQLQLNTMETQMCTSLHLKSRKSITRPVSIGTMKFKQFTQGDRTTNWFMISTNKERLRLRSKRRREMTHTSHELTQSIDRWRAIDPSSIRNKVSLEASFQRVLLGYRITWSITINKWTLRSMDTSSLCTQDRPPTFWSQFHHEWTTLTQTRCLPYKRREAFGRSEEGLSCTAPLWSQSRGNTI